MLMGMTRRAQACAAAGDENDAVFQEVRLIHGVSEIKGSYYAGKERQNEARLSEW